MLSCTCPRNLLVLKPLADAPQTSPCLAGIAPVSINRAKCPWSICAINATAFCELLFIYGWTSAAISATGDTSITQRIEKKARADLRVALPGSALAQNHRGDVS